LIKYKLNKSNESDINTHLQNSKEQFVPALDTYVDISEYAVKLRLKSNTFEAWNGTNLIGLIAVYSDALSQTAYITNVSIVKDFMRQGIAKTLINKCKIFYKSKAYLAISLEVFKSNKLAIDFYQKQEFYTKIIRKETIIMTAEINRNYNEEFKDNNRKYFYGFDLDVMHPFMLKAFTPFFNEGSMLELGSFKGEFTKRLLPHFTDITCVEASDEAVLEAKGSLGGKVQIHNSLFENLTLSKKFDNIVLTHVLEHIDSPVAL
jgi:N-acetylglutamate synthase-like GNAT family acetyltransferase